MKLASIGYDDDHRVGVLRDDGNLSLVDVDSMRDLIDLGDDGLERARNARESGPVVAVADVRDWFPPIPDPGKVLGVAMNNSASNERKISAPDHPAFFLKPASCLIGHGAPIHVHRYFGSVHPEPELAVVVGTTVRNVPASEAMQYVFGYTVFDDITSNGMRADDLFHYWAVYASDEDPDDVQRREQHLSYAARYKGSDTFGCMGPWLTTRDEVDDPDDLAVFCTVGGETVAEDSTRYYNYKVAELLSYISHFLTLESGDVLSCGTAFRAVPGRKSIHHANLQSISGPVEVRIDGLGTLVNPVIVDETPMGDWRLPDREEQEQ